MCLIDLTTPSVSRAVFRSHNAICRRYYTTSRAYRVIYWVSDSTKKTSRAYIFDAWSGSIMWIMVYGHVTRLQPVHMASSVVHQQLKISLLIYDLLCL